jgi:hypothetical protein
MTEDEDYRELGASGPDAVTRHPHSGPILAEGVEPALDAIAAKGSSFVAESVTRSDYSVPLSRTEIKACFVAQNWHKPYAEALIETDPANLSVLIAEAVQAILGRYLQLADSPTAMEETLDLLNAADALYQIRNAICGRNSPTTSVE